MTTTSVSRRHFIQRHAMAAAAATVGVPLAMPAFAQGAGAKEFRLGLITLPATRGTAPRCSSARRSRRRLMAV